MRNRWLTAFAVGLMAMVLRASPAPAQELVWEQTNGPYGGNVLALLATPDGRLYAGTQGGGVFRSENGGESWTAVNTGLTSREVQSLVVSGTTLYAGTDGGGVFRSADGGYSWIAVNTGLTNGYVQSLAVSGTTLYAGTDRGGGVFRSSDGGASWTAVNMGLTERSVRSLAVSGATLYAGTWDGVFRSQDGGNSWTATGLNRYVPSFAVSGATLYAGTSPGVFRSQDGGNSWTAVDTGLTNEYVQSLAVSGTTLFAGTYGGVFRSENGGNSWTAVNTGLTNGYVRSLAVSGAILFAGTYGGVFRLEDGGNSWTAVNTGLTNTDVQSLAVSGTTLYAGTGFGGVFRSENGGASWTAVNTGLTNKDIRSLAVSGTTLYAGTGGGGIFRSDDGGNSWTAVNTGLTGRDVQSFAVSGTTLYAGTWDGVFRSEDGGASWTATGLNTVVQSLAVFGTTLYAGTMFGVFRSEDGEASWTAINTGLTGRDVQSLAVAGATLYAGTGGGGGSGVFRLENGGNSWTAVNTGLTYCGITVCWNLYVQSLAVSGTTLYAGTHSGGVFRASLLGPTLSIPAGHVRPGESIGIPILLDYAANIAGIHLTLRYDTADWELADPPVVTADATQNWLLTVNADSPGKLTVVMAGTQAVAAGTVATLQLKAKASASPGRTAALDFETATLSDANGVKITPHTQSGGVIIHLLWDVNKDGVVNVMDLVQVGLAFRRSGTGLPADVNGDGVVDILDLIAVTAHFGESIPSVAAAPPAIPDAQLAPLLERWLAEARASNDGSELFRRGLATLERLLARIVPKQTVLLPNYPNPFNPETWLPYRLAADAVVTLTLYNARGEIVRTIVVGHQPAAVYESKDKAIHWDGRNDQGERVASGVYFYTLTAKSPHTPLSKGGRGDFTATRKMLILK